MKKRYEYPAIKNPTPLNYILKINFILLCVYVEQFLIGGVSVVNWAGTFFNYLGIATSVTPFNNNNNIKYKNRII